MYLVFAMSLLLFMSSTARSQYPELCLPSETEIKVLKSEKFNAQLSRDNCVKSICKGTKNLSDFKEELAKKRKKDIKISLDVQAIVNSSIENFKQLQAMAPLLEEKIDSPNFQKVRQEDKLTINLDWFLDKRYYFEDVEIEKLSRIQSDKELKKQYYELTGEKAGPNEIKWLLRMFKNKELVELLDLFGYGNKWSSDYSVLKTAKSYFPNTTGNNEIEEYVKMQVSTIKSLAAENRTYFKKILKGPIVQRLQKKPYLQDDLDFLKKNNEYMGLVLTISENPDLSKLINDRETSNGLTYKNKSNMKRVLKELPHADLKEVKKGIERALVFCNESLQIALKSAVATKKHNSNQRKLKQAKENLKSAFFKAYSRGSAIGISNRIDSISFEIPPSQESIRKQIQKMNTSLVANYDLARSEDENEMKYNIAKLTESLSDFPNVTSERIKQSVNGKAGQEIQSMCNSIRSSNWDNAPEITSIDDHTNPSINYIKVSPFTFNDLEQNMGIVYHELAHNIDAFMRKKSPLVSKESKETHLKKITCLTHQSQNFIFEEKSNIKDVQAMIEIDFSGEDFADVVAGAFYKKHNVACSLTDKLGDKELEPNYNFLAPNQLDDDHSNPFYRLLNTEKVRSGSLPKQCSDFLKHHTNGLKIQDCLKD